MQRKTKLKDHSIFRLKKKIYLCIYMLIDLLDFLDHSFNSNSEKKDESIETNENSLNSSNTKTEDESPPFELLEENTKFSLHEENSVDSHLSGISGNKCVIKILYFEDDIFRNRSKMKSSVYF